MKANKEPLTPLYVRLPAEQARHLEEAVSISGKSKRQIIEDAVREHLIDKGLSVGRLTPLTEANLPVGRITLSEDAPEVLTAPEAAALLRVSEEDILAAAGRGELPARALGDEWRFSRLALLAWLRGDQQPPPASA